MIKDQLTQDQITALKSGDKKKLETLRYILAQIKNKEIEKKTTLSDEEVIELVRKQLKELRESIDAFAKGGRADLQQASQAQYDILKAYLPAEISEEELATKIDMVIEKNKEVYNQNPKAIIGICMKELKTQADPQRIMKILQTKLS